MKNPEALKAVQKATICLWIYVAINIINALVAFFLPAPASIAASLAKTGISLQIFKLSILGFSAISVFLAYFIINHLKRGHNWARLIYLIFTIITTPSMLIDILRNIFGMSFSVFYFADDILHAGFGLSVIYFLFSAPGKILFEKDKSLAG